MGSGGGRPGRGTGELKGPGIATCLAFCRNRKEAVWPPQSEQVREWWETNFCVRGGRHGIRLESLTQTPSCPSAL